MKVVYNDLGFAKPEPHRMRRQGFPEAIFCPGKSDEQILSIFRNLLTGRGPVIATRAPEKLAQELVSAITGAVWHRTARLVVSKPILRRNGRPVAVVTGGTADIPVAEEAAVSLEALGRAPTRLYDVGVAGLHRLLRHENALSRMAAVIVCAGMDGALPSVVGGVVKCPVIAVPTSVGYGVHLGGVASLLTMLNSCAANVSVVNIDNGFGAAVIASLISR